MRLSILLPVRNEDLNLRVMLKLLRALVDVPYEVLVIYDDPGAKSREVVAALQSAHQNCQGILNDRGPGVSHAVLAGVAAARGEYVLIFAADEVGPVLAIDDMLALADAGCEFVSCTRYAHGGRRLGGSFVGGVLSRLANALFHWLAGSALTDCTTGIKLIRRDVFEKLQLESRPVGWVMAFEMSIKAQLLGLTLGEVPIVSIDRLFGGTSTFRLGPWVWEYSRWFFWGLLRQRRELRRQRRPVRVRVPSLATSLR